MLKTICEILLTSEERRADLTYQCVSVEIIKIKKQESGVLFCRSLNKEGEPFQVQGNLECMSQEFQVRI